MPAVRTIRRLALRQPRCSFRAAAERAPPSARASRSASSARSRDRPRRSRSPERTAPCSRSPRSTPRGGVLGKPIVLLAEDDRGEASEAASVVSKLITRDHVVALIGENASSRTLAAAPIAQSYKVPMVSPSSTNIEVTKKGDYIFRVCFIDPYQGQALATFARRDLKAATAAILVDARSDYSVGLAEAFRKAFEAAGGKVIDELKYTEGDSDFSAQLTALRPQKPDVLVVPGYYTDAGLIARQAQGARALGDAPRRRRLGLAQARRDRRRGHGRGLPLQPLLRGRPVARRPEVRRRVQGEVRSRARLHRGVDLRRDADPGRRDHARGLDGGQADPRRPRFDEGLRRASPARSRWMPTGIR